MNKQYSHAPSSMNTGEPTIYLPIEVQKIATAWCKLLKVFNQCMPS